MHSQVVTLQKYTFEYCGGFLNGLCSSFANISLFSCFSFLIIFNACCFDFLGKACPNLNFCLK